MKTTLLFSLLAAGLLTSCTSNGEKNNTTVKEYSGPNIETTTSPKGTNLFKPDSTSIAQNYKIPDWFKDAKFGIFIHWGVYSVPAFGNEWYPREMYDTTSTDYKHHIETYGKLTDFGYKDFIPMFKAQNFDPDAWAKLFKESGARYVVPVAEHHDGFALYHSTFNKWNSIDMGPHRDIIGDLKKALLKENLHFGLSSHRCENAWFYNHGMEGPSDVQNLKNTLYGERLHQPDNKHLSPISYKYPGTNENSRKEWLMETYELIDQYQPELIWFDWTVGNVPFQPTFYKFMAYYYNNAKDWNKGVVVNTKYGYGDNIQVFDIERGKSEKAREFPWQTDTSVGKKSWGYIKGEENKTPNQIIDDLIDIVAKNGNLLLNIGPKADGTITQEQQNVLRTIGAWLKVNGEAIYNTRPWDITASEGETKGTAGSFTDNTETKYTAQDIRFTTKGKLLYAISLGWSDGDILIHSLKGFDVKSVSMLGCNEVISWKKTKEGLKIRFPKTKPNDFAYALKISL
ncbi:MAG: alpha-L-fucosidase [Massilibacteroides sp.]|nr:alpha-L-fucosidase [Massilibacteroides sp.]